MIEHVLPLDGAALDDVLVRIGPGEVIREEQTDQGRRANLIRRVRGRKTE